MLETKFPVLEAKIGKSRKKKKNGKKIRPELTHSNGMETG